MFLWYNRGMSNKIVQLENEDGDNLYPLAGGALTGSISKTMLEEGVFEGPELTEPNTVAYVAEGNIQDDAVTTSKIADGSVTSDKVDWATMAPTAVMTLTPLANAGPASNTITCKLSKFNDTYFLFSASGTFGCVPTTSSPHIGFSIAGYDILAAVNTSFQNSNANAYTAYQTGVDFWMQNCDTTHNLAIGMIGLCKPSN